MAKIGLDKIAETIHQTQLTIVIAIAIVNCNYIYVYSPRQSTAAASSEEGRGGSMYESKAHYSQLVQVHRIVQCHMSIKWRYDSYRMIYHDDPYWNIHRMDQ